MFELPILGYDCPAVKNIWKFASYIAGASLTAAIGLITKQYTFSINWCGGWHHALRFSIINNTICVTNYITKWFLFSQFLFVFFSYRDSAQGFCYVNDIVLAIEALRKTFGRVLYIDLDVHHGKNS